jgi:hypothetical protein
MTPAGVPLSPPKYEKIEANLILSMNKDAV